MKLEYSEKQQAFHFNNGNVPENSNGYKTICEVINSNGFNERLNKAKNIRDKGHLTFERAKDIITN